MGNGGVMAYDGRCDFPSGFHGDVAATLSAITVDVPSRLQVSSLGYWSYALAGRRAQGGGRRDPAGYLKRAGGFVRQSSHSGYGNSLALEDYVGASNSVVADHFLVLLIANRLNQILRWIASEYCIFWAATVSASHG